MDSNDVAAAFAAVFDHAPQTIVRAPGRVNLIGEHVDYNDGLVLPMAIDRYCYVAAAPRPDAVVRIHSVQFDETVDIPLEGDLGERLHWASYIAAVVWSLRRARRAVGGADIVIDSQIRPGGGLSSSAALTVATAHALLTLQEERLDPIDLALVCQRAEVEYVGARVGIMDPLVAISGLSGHALLIDCRDLTFEPVAIDESEVAIVVANTMVKHDLATGAYNERRRECEAVLGLLRQSHPEARSLRDAASLQIQSETDAWPDLLRRRARHVISEIDRVQAAVEALRHRDYTSLGKLLNESHESLDRDYDVSCPELNTMVSLSRDLGALGARLTGGGFGGCVINLTKATDPERFARELAAAYYEATSVKPDVWVAMTADGLTDVR
jgi:galactokinase